jgi:putative membrane protein
MTDELASRRTSLAFQRTHMAADRTLMAVIRTSVSLISFGFTIAQFFSKLTEADILEHGKSAAGNFGITLVALGIALLAFGILHHVQFMRVIRAQRDEMVADGLIARDAPFPPSVTFAAAIAFLAVGVIVIVSLVARAGPFGH